MSEGSSGFGCLKAAGLGCGCLVVVIIAIVVLTSVSIVKPLERAVESREELEQRFGDQANYTPPPDGIPSADRIEAFIAVRQQLVEPCAKFSEIADEFREMERFDEQDEVSKVEVMGQALQTTTAALSMAPALGQFFETRNTALLESEMGLGEYTYLYVLGFHDHLTSDLGEDIVFDDDVTNSRIHDAMVAMLKAQREQARAGVEAAPFIAALDAEIEALETDRSRILWQDELPVAIAGAFEPHRTAIDQTFCPQALPFELARNQKRGFSVQLD